MDGILYKTLPPEVDEEYYKITEVARLYGLCTDTLRYYEEQGLLHPHRSRGGLPPVQHRRYL